MSGTSGMLAALANFNNRNTGSFYPELYRIKMLIINANKRSTSAVSTSYTTISSTPITNLISILQNLQTLFPGVSIYYSRTSSMSEPSASAYCAYVPGDFFVTTTTPSTYWIYISQIANATYSAASFPPYTTSTIVFTYTAISTTVLTSSTVPFILTSGATISSVNTYLTSGFTSISNPGSSIGSTTIGSAYTVVIVINYSFTSLPTNDFGLSFTSQFKAWLASVSNLSITQLVNVPLSTAGNQFSQLAASSFTILTAAVPIIRSGTSLVSCFEGCTTFNSNISAWDTSNVTNMSKCFSGCTAFNNNNAALTWNTSKVTDMSSMFYNANGFNQSISYNASSGFWNTSNVMTIAGIFNTTGTHIFNNGNSGSTPGSNKMNWILTGLSGASAAGFFVVANVTTTSSSSIYLWRNASNTSLNAANAPLALTTSGLGSAFLS